jgi:hypothetical protein
MEKELMTRNRLSLSTIIAAAILVCCVGQAGATLIAPHALFIDHRVRSGAIFVHNPDDKPVEINVELIYGYPRPDGNGGVHVFLEPEPADGEPSCAGWVRALPRRVILMPGQRQTIRLLAQPPADLPDGEYWSRVVISSKSAQRSIEDMQVEGAEGVRVGLSLATRTIISLNYRKGPVFTGVELGEVTATPNSDEIEVAMDLKRLGDAAWLGQVDAVLLDADGEEVVRWDQLLAVYEDQVRTMRFPWRRRQAEGDYLLSLTLSTEREDLTSDELLPAATVVRAVPVRIGAAEGR